MTVTPGIWVRQILANHPKILSKYASVAPENMTFGEILQVWSEVTGREAVYFEVSKKQYEELWGIIGNELARKLEFGEVVSDWTAAQGDEFLSMEDLGISEQGIGCKPALERLKEFL